MQTGLVAGGRCEHVSLDYAAVPEGQRYIESKLFALLCGRMNHHQGQLHEGAVLYERAGNK